MPLFHQRRPALRFFGLYVFLSRAPLWFPAVLWHAGFYHAIEKQTINGKEVWLKVDQYLIELSEPDANPTEYFTAAYYLQEPASDAATGEVIKDENGEPKLFESPVAALAFARKRVERAL